MEEPDYFRDLYLGQVARQLFGEREKDVDDMLSVFYTPLKDVETITYRQDIFRDLDSTSILERVRLFAKKLSDIFMGTTVIKRDFDAPEKYRSTYLTKGRFLDFVPILSPGQKYRFQASNPRASTETIFRNRSHTRSLDPAGRQM